MESTKKYQCERCGRKYTISSLDEYVEISWTTASPKQLLKPRNEYLLCPWCFDSFKHWWDGDTR